MQNKFLINAEYLEARLQAARDNNPNKERIKEIRAHVRGLLDEMSNLSTDEEKYANLLFVLADTTEKASMAKVMDNQELCHHLIGLFEPHILNEMDEAIFNEALDRLGYENPADKDEDE